MSIRPIDMMMMPNKSQETSIFQHQEQQKLEHSLQHQEYAFGDQVKKDGERTVKSEKSENEEFRFKDGKGNGQHAGTKKGQQGKKEEKEKPSEIKLSNFDIRI